VDDAKIENVLLGEAVIRIKREWTALVRDRWTAGFVMQRTWVH
jgi:hypothetical protein